MLSVRCLDNQLRGPSSATVPPPPTATVSVSPLEGTPTRFRAFFPRAQHSFPYPSLGSPSYPLSMFVSKYIARPLARSSLFFATSSHNVFIALLIHPHLSMAMRSEGLTVKSRRISRVSLSCNTYILPGTSILSHLRLGYTLLSALPRILMFSPRSSARAALL